MTAAAPWASVLQSPLFCTVDSGAARSGDWRGLAAVALLVIKTEGSAGIAISMPVVD